MRNMGISRLVPGRLPLLLLLLAARPAPTAAQCPEITAAQLNLTAGAFVATQSGNCVSGTCRLGCRCGFVRQDATDAVCNSDSTEWTPALPTVRCDVDPSVTGPKTIHVSASSGDDAQDGSAGAPLRTLHKAVSKVTPSSCGADTIQLSPGVFDSPSLLFELTFRFEGQYETTQDNLPTNGILPDLELGDIMWSSRWYLESDASEGILQDVAAGEFGRSFIDPDSDPTKGPPSPWEAMNFGKACLLTQAVGPAPFNFKSRGHILSVRNRFDASASPSPASRGASLVVQHAATTFAIFYSADVTISLEKKIAFLRGPVQIVPDWDMQQPGAFSGPGSGEYVGAPVMVAMHESMNSNSAFFDPTQHLETYFNRWISDTASPDPQILGLHASVVSLVLFQNPDPSEQNATFRHDQNPRVVQVYEEGIWFSNFSGSLVNGNFSTDATSPMSPKVLHVAVDDWAQPFHQNSMCSDADECQKCESPVSGQTYPTIELRADDGSYTVHKVCDVRVYPELIDKFQGGAAASISCGPNPENHFHRTIAVASAVRQRAEVVALKSSNVPATADALKSYEVQHVTWQKTFEMKALSGGVFGLQDVFPLSTKPNLYFATRGNCEVRPESMPGAVLVAAPSTSWNGAHVFWTTRAPFHLTGSAAGAPSVITSRGIRDAPGIHIREDWSELDTNSSLLPHGQNRNSSFRLSNLVIEDASPGIVLDGVGSAGLVENIEIRRCSNAATSLGANQYTSSDGNQVVWPAAAGAGVVMRCGWYTEETESTRCSSRYLTHPEDLAATRIRNVSVLDSHSNQGGGAGMNFQDVVPELVDVRVSGCSASSGFGIPGTFRDGPRDSMGGGIFLFVGQNVHPAWSPSQRAGITLNPYSDTKSALQVWTSVRVESCAAAHGGGLQASLWGKVALELRSSVIRDNVAISGGGVVVEFGALIMNASAVQRNSCSSMGCGMRLLRADLTSTSAVLVSNNSCGPMPRLFGQAGQDDVSVGLMTKPALVTCQGAGMYLEGASFRLFSSGNLEISHNEAVCASCAENFDMGFDMGEMMKSTYEQDFVSSVNNFAGGAVFLSRSTIAETKSEGTLRLAGNKALLRGAAIMSDQAMFSLSGRYSSEMRGNTVVRGLNDRLYFGEGALGSVNDSSTQAVDLYVAGGVGPFLSCDPGTMAWTRETDFWLRTGLEMCVDCAPGTHQNARGQATCADCPAGKYQNERRSTTCKICPAGFFCPAGSADPVECIVGGGGSAVYCLEGLTVPVSVAAGFQGANDTYSGTNRTFTAITPVRPGFFSSDGIAVKCRPGHEASIQGLSQCSPCSAGRFADDFGEETCKACTSGKFSEHSGATACSDCPRGYYSPSSAFAQCLVCGPGKFSPSDRSLSCADCPKAKYSAALASEACQFCDIGLFSPANGSVACLACSLGKKSRDVPALRFDCEACSPGRYSDTFPRSSCKACLAGQYSPASSATACQQCGAGQFAAGNGSSACEDCPVNTYGDRLGRTSCTQCPDNTESTRGSRACVQVVRYLLSIELKLNVPEGAPMPSCEKIANFSAQLAGVEQDDIVLKTPGCPSTPGARQPGRRRRRRLSGLNSQVLAWEASISASSSSEADEISARLDQTLNNSAPANFTLEDGGQAVRQYSVHSISTSKQGNLLVESPALAGVSAHPSLPTTAALVSWQHVPYAAAYLVYVSSSKNMVIDKQRRFDYSVDVGSSSPLIGDALTFACSDLAPAGGVFYARVVGVDENNVRGTFSSWSEPFVLAAPPGSVHNLAVGRGNGNRRYVASVSLSITASNPLSSAAFLRQQLRISYRPVPAPEASDRVGFGASVAVREDEAENVASYSATFQLSELQRLTTGPRDVDVSLSLNMHPGTSAYPYVFTAVLYSPSLETASEQNDTALAYAKCSQGTYRSTHMPLHLQRCELCPENAYCPENGNASTVVPEAGHWRVGWIDNTTQSGAGDGAGNQTPAVSLLFVPCPFPAACCGAFSSPTAARAWQTSTERGPGKPAGWCVASSSELVTSAADSISTQQNASGASEDTVGMEEACAPGHFGVACAQCEIGLARASDGKCVRCASVSDHTSSMVGLAILYFVLFSVSLVFACRTNFRLARTFQDSNLVKAKGIVDHWQSLVEARRERKEREAHAAEVAAALAQRHKRGSSILDHLHNPFHYHGGHLSSEESARATERAALDNFAAEHHEKHKSIFANLHNPLHRSSRRNRRAASHGRKPEGGAITEPTEKTGGIKEGHAAEPPLLPEPMSATAPGTPGARRRRKNKSGHHHRRSIFGLVHVPPHEEAPDLDEVAYNAKSLLILTPDSMPGGLAVGKIFLTHFTILSLAGSFNVEWQMPTNWLVINIDFFSAVSREVFDVTCLQEEGSDYEAWSIPPHFMKLVVLLAVPVLNVVCIALPWSCLVGHLVNKSRKKWHAKNPGNDAGPKRDPFNSLSLVTVLMIGIGITAFFWHATITKATFAVFSCNPVGNRFFLSEDFGIECYVRPGDVHVENTDNTVHAAFISAVAIPSIIVYVLGIPVVASLVLWRRRQKLKEWDTLMMFGALYDGMKTSAYFWEVMAIPVRRVVLVFVVIFSQIGGVFNGSTSGMPQGDVTMLLALIVVIVARFHLLATQPYVPTLQTEIESHALAVEAMTFFGALFMFSRNVSEPVKQFVSVLVFLINLGYFMLVFWVLVWLRRTWVVRAAKHQCRVLDRVWRKVSGKGRRQGSGGKRRRLKGKKRPEAVPAAVPAAPAEAAVAGNSEGGDIELSAAVVVAGTGILAQGEVPGFDFIEV